MGVKNDGEAPVVGIGNYNYIPRINKNGFSFNFGLSTNYNTISAVNYGLYNPSHITIDYDIKNKEAAAYSIQAFGQQFSAEQVNINNFSISPNFQAAYTMNLGEGKLAFDARGSVHLNKLNSSIRDIQLDNNIVSTTELYPQANANFPEYNTYKQNNKLRFHKDASEDFLSNNKQTQIVKTSKNIANITLGTYYQHNLSDNNAFSVGVHSGINVFDNGKVKIETPSVDLAFHQNFGESTRATFGVSTFLNQKSNLKSFVEGDYFTQMQMVDNTQRVLNSGRNNNSENILVEGLLNQLPDNSRNELLSNSPKNGFGFSTFRINSSNTPNQVNLHNTATNNFGFTFRAEVQQEIGEHARIIAGASFTPDVTKTKKEISGQTSQYGAIGFIGRDADGKWMAPTDGVARSNFSKITNMLNAGITLQFDLGGNNKDDATKCYKPEYNRAYTPTKEYRYGGDLAKYYNKSEVPNLGAMGMQTDGNNYSAGQLPTSSNATLTNTALKQAMSETLGPKPGGKSV